MGRIIEQIVNNPKILEDYKNKPEINLVKVQTVTGSTYMGYIKDSDEEGVWFEPLMGDFYPTYIFKSDLKKIIVPLILKKKLKRYENRNHGSRIVNRKWIISATKE